MSGVASRKECCIAGCTDCEARLLSPFPARRTRRDPDGLGTFAAELCDELCIDANEIGVVEISRAWARAFGWRESDDGWQCPQHVRDLSDRDEIREARAEPSP